jgi:hypothetical protein
VVDREDVVIDDPLEEVEESPADEHPAKEGASVDRPAPVRRAPPEDVETNGNRDPGGRMEEATQSVFVSSPETVVSG